MSSAYTQSTAKRQKVREARVGESVDYFHGIDKIEYNNIATHSDTTNYRYYNPTERVHGRLMEDWLKYSISFTEFRRNGYDNFPKPTPTRPWDDHTNTIENYKRCIKAVFDLCTKLGVKYWTAFDSDLVPFTDNWDENRTYWDEIVDFIQDITQRCHVKLLWIAPDLHSHPRYASGAMTSNEASTFIQAATQIKKCLEISQRLNTECFLLWPYREGYDSIFQADVAREVKLFSKLLKLTAEYKERLNYRCQLLIMPYYSCDYGNYSCNFGRRSSFWRQRDVINTYMWDVTSCLYFLKIYNLDRYYKVCSPPGHHMYMANIYNMLGGVFITNECDQCDSKGLTLMIKCIVDQGPTPPGGINLKLTSRRECDPRDLVTAYVKYIDAIGKALRFACNVVAEQIFSKHVQQRYSSYYSGLGSRLISSDISMEDCEEYHKKNQSHHSGESATKTEHIELVFQRYIDTCDHI